MSLVLSALALDLGLIHRQGDLIRAPYSISQNMKRPSRNTVSPTR